MSSNSSTLKCDNLIQYLSRLGKAMIDKLYTNSSTCLAVFRELPELAKHFVMRLLFIEQPIPQQVIASWVKNNESVPLLLTVIQKCDHFSMFQSIHRSLGSIDKVECLEESDTADRTSRMASQPDIQGEPQCRAIGRVLSTNYLFHTFKSF